MKEQLYPSPVNPLLVGGGPDVTSATGRRGSNGTLSPLYDEGNAAKNRNTGKCEPHGEWLCEDYDTA